MLVAIILSVAKSPLNPRNLCNPPRNTEGRLQIRWPSMSFGNEVHVYRERS
jgi:hypothetical protein